MPLHPVHISDADADAAKYEMFHHPDPIVQKRMLCVRMKYLRFEHEDIAETIGCCRNTVGNYLNLYEESGLEGLRLLNYNKPQSRLDRHSAKVEASFREHPPRSVKEAAKRIKKLVGISRSISRTRQFLHRLGMKPRQTGQVPAKADPVAQRKYHDEKLQPLLHKAEKGECHVLFMDSAHFVLAAFVAIVWCFERTFVKTAPGRFRLNVIGAINATSKELTALYNTTYITATTVVELLEGIAEQYAGLPIHIFLDNARYQHCQLVKDAAKRLGISLEFLPPYSPNLNLIERLWKFAKAEVLAANYFQDSKTFQKAIIDFLNRLHKKKMKKELNSRLSFNFQLFGHAQNLAA
jgi:transposase